MNEIWKPVPGYPNYLVSNKGRVASIMRGTSKASGHPMIVAVLGNKKRGSGKGRLPRKGLLIHRMMLEAFVGPPPFPGAVCRHLNDIATDNRLENLKWGTAKENAEDAFRNGRRLINEDSSRAKLSNKDIIKIRYLYDAKCPLEMIATTFNISNAHVCGIGKRKFWKRLPEDPVFDELMEMTE